MDRREEDAENAGGPKNLLAHQHQADRRRQSSPRCQYCNRHGEHSTKNSSTCARIWSATSTLIILVLSAICIYLLYLVVFGGGSESHIAQNDEKLDEREANLPLPPGTLRLVSVLSRHGDRAPAGHMPPGDDMAQLAKSFWPAGLDNLTDTGRFRMFRMGLELRRRYDKHLDFDANHFLAFSSRMDRCRESLGETLRGLFEIDWPLERGLELVDRWNAAVGSISHHDESKPKLSLPAGSGSPLEYRQVVVDTQTVPSLSYGERIFPCKFQLEHPNELDRDIFASPQIRNFKGFASLQKTISKRYGMAPNSPATLGVCGTAICELQLRRTSRTIENGRHYFEWIHTRAPEYTRANVSLLELCDQVTSIVFEQSQRGEADRLQMGPILTSLVTSQMAALAAGQQPPSQFSVAEGEEKTFASRELFADKKAILYSSHDIVLQALLSRLGVARPLRDGDLFESQLARWSRSARSDTEKFLAGLGVSKFGLSFVLELYELNGGGPTGNHSFAYLQMALYNEEDAKFKPVRYKRVEFGRACRRVYEEENPHKSADPFFKQRHESLPGLDEALSCPFELFKEITRKYMIGQAEFQRQCSLA